MNAKSFALSLALLASSQVFSQKKPITINSDNSVTITFVAPDADEVQIQGNFLKKKGVSLPIVGMFAKDGKADMEKGEDGIWTFTSSPLNSELYWYNFIIGESDSTSYDNRNKNITRDINTIYNYFIIGGGIGDNYKDNKTQQGRIEYVWYPSTLNGMSQRRMAVYLPYGYNSDTTRRYPVLYLLHGSGGDETAWVDCGRLVQIMNNLILIGRCVPMIVVMPNENVELAAAPGDDPNNPGVKPSANNYSSMFGKAETVFPSEVIGYVDKQYRTIPDKSHRAIAGLSLGGLHTLFISLNNPTLFDYLGLFSAQTTNVLDSKSIARLKSLGGSWKNLKEVLPFLGGGKLDKKLSNVSSDDNIEIYAGFDKKLKTLYDNNLKLFYIAVGTDDFTKKLNDDLRKKLDKSNYRYLYNETNGGHTWTNWRRYLIDYLPKLFRQ